MNQADTPFNPIVIPDLNLPSGEPPAVPAEPTPVRPKTKPRLVRSRASRNGTLRRALTIPASEPLPAQPEVTSPRRKASKSPATAKTRRALDPKASVLRFTRKVTRKAKVSWKRVKAGITARLAHLDQAKLKKLLIACGVAAAVATAIVVVAKLTPLIVTLLALLGLGAVLQMWERLRVTRIPA